MSTHLRRSRGYNFEHNLVQLFNKQPGWWARRLGGSSTGLPDIVATSDRGILLAIECKSTYSNAVYIPPDQVERCEDVIEGFNHYRDRHIIFAVKFARHVGMKEKNRKEKIFFIDEMYPFNLFEQGHAWPSIKITYNHEYIIRYPDDFTITNIEPPEYKMPWKS